MAKKADNIFVRAKAYVKDHPRTSFQDAIQKVKGKKVSGTKPKAKVAGTKRPRTTSPAKVASTRPRIHHTGAIAKAKKIVADIDKLERERKALKNREMKDIYALEINKLHRQLKTLKKAS